MVLLLAGLAVAANASVTLEMRSVGRQGFGLAQDDGTISVQMVTPGVLHVHYVPMGNKTASSLVIDPQRASATTFRPNISRQGDGITLRSIRMVANWDPKTNTLTVKDAQGHVLLRQSDVMAVAQEQIVLEHAPGDALYGI
ncbi:MAG TPA: hypothetical protein VJQ42_09630, partial [Rhodanobacteraceae bacterium]|nr:hypothetical protein [Rhodanobacteraceae bacterium]